MILPTVGVLFGWILVRLYELYIRKSSLYVKHPWPVLTVLTLILGLWFLAALIELPKLYVAASDTNRNQYGGPAMLSLYIDSWYYQYVFRLLSQLRILYVLFVPFGGLAAVCKNGKRP